MFVKNGKGNRNKPVLRHKYPFKPICLVVRYSAYTWGVNVHLLCKRNETVHLAELCLNHPARRQQKRNLSFSFIKVVAFIFRYTTTYLVEHGLQPQYLILGSFPDSTDIAVCLMSERFQ